MKKIFAVILVLAFAIAAPCELSAAAQSTDTENFMPTDGRTIRFFIEGNETAPGETVVLRAVNIPESAIISVDTDIQFSPLFFREPKYNNYRIGDMIAFLPISYYTAPGEHYITLKCGEATQKFLINVAAREFSTQHLTVPQETAEETILSQKADAEYEKYIAPVRKSADAGQRWSGGFIWPLKTDLRVTTQFGAIRYTNGGSTPSRHGALDFAAPAGSPVYASGAGRVAYAGYLQLTGYTVVIEHGYGLKTWYYHMNSINVETDDTVKQGQQIGAVGSTGFSTGAHLHFGMSVSNQNGHVFINPDTAMKNAAAESNMFETMARDPSDIPQD